MPSTPSSPVPLAVVAGVRRLVFEVKYWAPVWIPGMLLWQFTTKGLQPTLTEAHRLEEVAPGVNARHVEAKSAFEQVQAEAKAWQDPVYRERRRRLRSQEPNPERLAQEYEEAALGEPVAETLEGWYDSEESLDANGDWQGQQASPAEFLEDYNNSAEEPSEALLEGQSTWGTVGLNLQPTDPRPLTLSSPTWSASPVPENSPQDRSGPTTLGD
ncbi:MAG: hypothetical protein GY930_01355 [bacterium]|nr:hypothetical protein [bacterium]